MVNFIKAALDYPFYSSSPLMHVVDSLINSFGFLYQGR